MYVDDEELNKIDSADANAFSFVDVAGSFIQNATFSAGLKNFQTGNTEEHDAFIYKVLSAAGEDIGQTIYDNVKRYISYISDVDVCKVKSLKSMLKLFGFKYTIFDKFDTIPLEILNLLDLLSINRKFLVKDGWFKSEFIEALSSGGVIVGNAIEDSVLDIRHLFRQNTYSIDYCDCLSSAGNVDIKKLKGNYIQQNSKKLLEQTFLSNFSSNEQDLSSTAIFKNKFGYLIVDQLSSYNLYNENLQPVLAFPENATEYLTSYGRKVNLKINSLSGDYEESFFGDQAFIQLNKNLSLELSFNSIFRENVQQFDDQQYEMFLEDIYRRVISSYITLPYNVEVLKNKTQTYVPLYPDLGPQYYKSFTSLRNYLNFSEDDMLSVKAFYHISKNFDQVSIVDAIELGNDSIENYSGAELSIIGCEIEKRRLPLQLSSLALKGVDIGVQSPLQTRGTYFRKKKVLEFARFVDDYFSKSHQDPSIYDFDPNYYVVSSDASQISTVISQTPVGDPKIDINSQMIEDIALYLTKLTKYIQKIREKIKQQTQKNYMKGTNLLLIYIINEYLIDYAKHNQKSLIESGLSTIYENLHEHQFKESENTEDYTINPVEYYDETNYFNLSSISSNRSVLSSQVNRRFWESKNNLDSKGLLKDDGLYFSIEDIERFYLSTLSLNSKISGNLPAFLSSIFDLGADQTFIYNLSGDSSLSIFSSVLSNGVFASDIYEQLIDLSNAWLAYRKELDTDYQFDNSLNAKEQLSDSLENSIYVRLSNNYLANVSGAYNANIGNIERLSNSIDVLSNNYYSFITSDYSFYYKKFESKYCYEDHDIDTGAYKHNWYIGNPTYDLPNMTLYEHLFQLDKYSDQTNIVNWALSDILEYVETGFDSIYGQLRSDVINEIGQYGFIDINALTLDSELTYTYDFLNELIASRKQFLRDQLASMQQQASALKTQYEALNNTFTTAVASFNDNNAGYNLGDSTIYAVSINECRPPIFKNQRCTRSSSKPSSKAWKFCVNVEGNWYYGANEDLDSGSYGFEEQNISPTYSLSTTLEQRCKAVKAYMSTMTHFAITNYDSDTYSYDIQPYYGFQNEGIAAVADNTEAALANIESAYESLKGMANDLFGITTSDSSIDIYDNILSLIEKLVGVDESFFDNDEIIARYKQYVRKVIDLSSQYLPVKEAFDSIFKTREFGIYLVNFIPVQDLTYDNIQNLKRYVKKTDAENLEIIRSKIDGFYGTFDDLLKRKDEIELCIFNYGISSISFTTGNNIEQYIYQMKQTLLDDIELKTNRANAIIDLLKTKIQANVDVISNEVSANLESTNGIESIVDHRLAELNFFDHYNYQQYQKLFLAYGGQNFCYDPYYNMRNTVHPSYQVHPYLWNFIRKMNSDSLIESGFQTKAVDELEEDNVNSFINEYLNQYGMTINNWINSNKGLIDYTGYLSRYEMSENYSPATGLQNEVVDYDGAFYPPAISAFRKNRDVCINSVKYQYSKTDCLVQIAKSIPNDISSYLTLSGDQDFTISSEEIYQFVGEAITSFLDISLEDVKAVIDDCLIGYPLSVATESRIVNAFKDYSSSSFYEKYYKHLNLSDSEYQKIARQLDEYGDQIVSITNPAYIADVYDIYKYGVDLNGNSYILYKKYDYSKVEELKDMTFSIKRNTPGQMWIRLAHHPIAFPAFTGCNPTYFIHDSRMVNMSILSVAAKENPNAIVWEDDDRFKIQQISSQMNVFFDFEISKSKSSIAYMTINGDYKLIDQYKRFDLAWVIGNQIQTYYDQTTDLEWLQILNNNGAGIERIDFNYNSSLGQHYIGLDALAESSVIYPSLIGCYPINDSEIDFVYIDKKFGISGDLNGDFQISSSILSAPSMFAIKIKDGITYLKTSEQIMTNVLDANQIIVGDCACVGYDNDQNQTILAFTTRTIDSDDKIDTCTTSGMVDFSKNADGPTIDDPLDHFMTSHDYLQQNVTIAKFKRKTTSFQFKSISIHNLNADISYIPSYPSLSNEAKIYSKWPDQDWYDIELLGRAKDIDDFIKLVNPNPNPYLDYDSIMEEVAHGRVYEDYNKNEDKTFRLVLNPALNSNSPSEFSYSGLNTDLLVSYNDGDDYIQYQILLDQIYKPGGVPYSDVDYKNLKLLVYNKNTLGKNPYLMCDLNVLSTTPVELEYNKDPKTQTSEVSVLVSDLERNQYYAVGTKDSFDLTNRCDSNHFNNIYKITVEFDRDSSFKLLTFKFYIKDKSFPFNVPAGAFDVLLHNPYDLTMFKYYHYLDAYGAVNCKYLIENLDTFRQADNGRGWGIYYDPSIAELDKYKDPTMSYFVDDAGLTTWLKEIELSDYRFLSDIYVLSGYEALGFKYDEELRFAVSSDLYYYPTMNLSYPKQAADYVQYGKMIAKSTSGELSILKSLFDESNLFIVDLDDPKRISDKIGNVAIPVMINNVDDARAFEDWLETSSFLSTFNLPDGTTSSTMVDLRISEIYGSDDPRAFAWLRYSSEISLNESEVTSNGYDENEIDPNTGTEIPFDIDDSAWKKKRTSEFVEYTISTHNLVPMTSEELVSDYQTEYVFVDMNSHTVDLARMMKLYINYKKNPETKTLDLYFNYFNWFDTSYIKIIDNKTYIDTIEGTYLKLEAGKDGFLDIIIQVKYYNSDELCGYKNIKVLSYHIWNISDDKPKFLIQKVYEIEKDSQGIDDKALNASLNFASYNLVLDHFELDQIPEIPIWFTIASDCQLSSEVEFYVSYPSEILDLESGTYGVMKIDNDLGISGLNKIHIYNTNVKTHEIPFKSKLTIGEITSKYKSQTMNILVEDAVFYEQSGRECNLSTNDCTVSFKKENQVILSTKKNQSGNAIQANSAIRERAILTQI